MSVNLNSTTGINLNSMNDYSTNPIVIVVVVITIVLYYLLFSSLGTETASSGTASSGIGFIELLLWGVFILLILLNGMAYIFNINIIASIKNIFSSSPSVDIIVDTESTENGLSSSSSSSSLTPQLKKQVFHISDNKYDYDNSKAICQAYGARLASYDELNSAYNEGADWCGFGWSEGQMALYPTQTEKWKSLQGIKGHEHDCGRPGINGGYIDNPNVRFGVNCYGYKPKITPEDAQTMMNTPLYPKTTADIEFDKKVDYWRSKLQDILVAPFNHNNWSVV